MINPLLKNIGEDVMGFLNEIQLKYPKAISLASGRPDEQFFGLEDFPEYFNIYVDAVAVAEKKERTTVLNSLGQYNRAKGIINEQVARYLEEDEDIKADPEDLLITVGSQEAMVLVLMTLCDKEKDVIIVEDPTYVGITHFAIIAGYPVTPVPVDEHGICLGKLEQKILAHRQEGKKVRIVYVIADFQNPTGNVMPVENRLRLLELADKYDFLIMEDNAYGEFTYDDVKILSLKALDTNDRVIYLRSFSKTLYPSLRLAALVAGQKVVEDGKTIALSDLMAKVKGYITVNTPSINQAVFGGILIKNNYSLTQMNRDKIANLKEKRDQLLSSLDNFLDARKFSWAEGISWNIPGGGFFITIKVPFKVDKEAVIVCAEQYHMVFTPMSFFYLGEGGDHELRLAFSHVPVAQINTGIERLAAYLQNRIQLNH